MSEWDDELSQDELEGDENLNEEPIDESSAVPSEKYEKLLGEDSKKYKLSGMFKDWFLDYSSYVILQRAVPNIVDGLKPVQRRVLHAMYEHDTGAYSKVAGIVGEAMHFHPHGDASILGALVQLGQKGYAIDCQGNWGNILTGDPNAAGRYIEARLSKFAKDVIFDPKITEWMTSYDGRNHEPVELPVRFPLLLAQGTEGIAVGMASKILPHNFNELIDASIAYLQGKEFELLPDFPTGGYADCSKYMKGQRGGSVKVRAKIEKIDKNTLAIKEIPYGKTTHILVDSILKAKDKGKIKIKKIEDMTTDTADLVIHLPNDVSPDKTIDALYAFTDCETNIAPNACVIKDNKPQFLSVDDILIYDTEHTRDLLKKQLEIKKNELEDNWHYTSLEKIFFENRVYKILEEDQKTWEAQIKDVFKRMCEFQGQLIRKITMDDILKLVEKPVRKISKFDTKVIDQKILDIEKELNVVKDNIEHITEYTIKFFQNIKSKYGKDFPRRTEITDFETITATKVVSNNAKLYANLETGFVGIGLKKDEGDYLCDCSDMSEIIVIGKDGKYLITKVSDKAFFATNLLYVGIFNRGDSRTIYNVIYRDGKSTVYYAKRFAITSVTRDKEYDITQGKPGSNILWFSVNHNGEAETVKIYFRARPKLKKLNMEYDFSELAIKGKVSRGNLVTKNAIQKISLRAKGISTIGGKSIWFDTDVQRLNEDGRGMLLGEFSGNDKIIAVFKNGTYYTTSYDLSNRYQGDLLLIEKYDENKVYAALYYDGENFYIKRFSFPPSDNSPASFIADNRGAYLADFSADKHPQFMVTFTGRQEHREPEKFDAEEFIAKKGITAKGNRCHRYDILKVEFIEPLHKPEDDEEEGAKPGEIISLGPEDIPDDETFSPESMYQPTGEGEETHGDLGEPDPDSDDADEPNLFDL
ncbi:MAG: DNA gyrase/topoisomerase IV subunit A [Candidatus Cryptobacteroides sp.]|nr:DNA gyrase/topoisomerase IV subunit A [Bacteroides sp.]MDY5302121.1 DNA gyrase/topoisomerase IV subunit A [Candidatus Cryptobacteroides sp.]MDY5407110.1 DNA gyrase/topoisomerase IV subunit A [Candidatus Cryptobacteroides sp.]